MELYKRIEEVRKLLPALLLVVGILVVAGCGDAGTTGSTTTGAGVAVEELRAIGFDEYLGVQEPSETWQEGKWTGYAFDPDAKNAICLLGDPYRVFVREGPSDKVLVLLGGGGACWDKRTCLVAQTASTRAGPPGSGGILDFENPENPFRDFDVVYVPYCDGSVHSGDTTVDYDGTTVYHHGFRNLSTGADAVRRHFPDPELVVVAGLSAGGYGTYAGYGVLRVALPETEIIVFNDSGPGVQNLEASDDVLSRSDNWNFERLIPASCEGCGEQPAFLTTWATERDPSLRTALFSYKRDGVISFFLGLSGSGYESLLLDITGQVLEQNRGRYARFIADGSGHTALGGPGFYRLEIGGMTFPNWTGSFLQGDDSWTDTVE
jgi:hypothetical protein